MNNSTVDYKVAQETAVLRADYRFLPAILGRSLFMKVLNYVRSTGFSALDLSPRFVNGISSRSFDRLAGSSDPLADSRPEESATLPVPSQASNSSLIFKYRPTSGRGEGGDRDRVPRNFNDVRGLRLRWLSVTPLDSLINRSLSVREVSLKRN